MKKNKFSPFLYFLLISVAIILSFDLFTIPYIKETHSISSPLFGLELDPNWNVSKENGKIILSGSELGYATISMKKIEEIRIKEDLKKQILPSVVEKIEKVEFRMNPKKGGVNLNLENIGSEGIHRMYTVNFHRNGVDIMKSENENVLLHKTYPFKLSFGKWYEVKTWIENRTIYLKVNNFTLSFYDPDLYPITRISFQTWEGSSAKVSDIKIGVKKKEITRLLREDFTVLGRICCYLFFLLGIFLLFFKINARYAAWFFLGCLATFIRERPTLWFSQQTFTGDILLPYTIPFLIVSSYILRKGYRDFYSLLLGGIITNSLIAFGGGYELVASGVIERIDIIGASLMIFVAPLLLIDKYISKKPVITFQERIYEILTDKTKFYLLLFLILLIFLGYSEIGLAVSPLPFYLSVIALIAEFTLLYLMFSFLSDSTITSLSISEILPNRKEWKILAVTLFPIYFLLLAFFVWREVLTFVPLSIVILSILITLLPLPFWIILLKKCKKKHMKTVNIELKRYVNKKVLLIFLCLNSLPLFFLVPISMALRIVMTVIVLFFLLVDVLK